MRRRSLCAAVLVTLAGIAAPAAGCSLLESFPSYPEGSDAGRSGDGAHSADGPADRITTDGPADSPIPADALPSCNGGAGFCAPAVPGGWAGPAIFYEGPVGAAADCVSGYTMTYTGFVQPSGVPAVCTPCTCDPSPIACGAALTLPAAKGFCTGTDGGTDGGTYSLEGGCTGLSPYESIILTPYAGQCVPHGGDASLPGAWSSTATACAPTAATSMSTCAPGAFCLPQIPGPFSHRFCVSQAGDLACPAGGYGVKYLTYGTGTDSRGCTSCACGSPKGRLDLCQFDAALCPLAECSGGCTAAVQSFNGCVYTGSNASVSVAPMGTVGDASCPPSGGDPAGELTPTLPTTFCCTL
jgi:hypothetical protein